MTSMLALLAGLFCLLAAGLLVGLAVYQMRRPRAAPPPAPPVGLNARIGPPGGPKASPKLPSQSEGAYDEEEAPTVIVNQPTRAEAEAGRPSKVPSQLSSPPAPGGRTSGATIIAFDEEDEDE